MKQNVKQKKWIINRNTTQHSSHITSSSFKKLNIFQLQTITACTNNTPIGFNEFTHNVKS